MATFYTRIILDNKEETEIVILNQKYTREEIAEKLKGQNENGFISEIVSKGRQISADIAMEMMADGSISYVPEDNESIIAIDDFCKYDTLIIQPNGDYRKVEYNSPFKPVCDKIADKLDDIWFWLRKKCAK